MPHRLEPLPCVLLQAWLMRKAQAVMRSNLQYTDERSKLEGELMAGIDVAKCYAWEVSLKRGGGSSHF